MKYRATTRYEIASAMLWNILLRKIWNKIAVYVLKALFTLRASVVFHAALLRGISLCKQFHCKALQSICFGVL